MLAGPERLLLYLIERQYAYASQGAPLGRYFMLCSSFPRRFDSPLAVTFSDSFSCRPASGSTLPPRGPVQNEPLPQAQPCVVPCRRCTAGCPVRPPALPKQAAQLRFEALMEPSLQRKVSLSQPAIPPFFPEQAIGGQRLKCADRQEEEGDRGEESEFHWRSFRANDGCMLSQARAVRFRERADYMALPEP